LPSLLKAGCFNMKKLLGYIFTPVHYIGFGLSLCVFHPIQWLTLKYGGYKAHKKCVDILNFFLVSTYYLIGARIKFSIPYALPQNRPIIFIANHQSVYDLPPLIWFLRKHHAKFISKIELTRGIPSISFNLKHGGGANIDRSDPKQSISEIIKFAGRMKDNNWSAFIFPEGTRSRDGELKPFALAGVAALLKKVPNALVVPIAIQGPWKMTRYGNYPLSFGEKLSWTVLPSIEPDKRPAQDVLTEAEDAIRGVVSKKL
jgi:1-acyl-sn-glycerol-3-phosphate acyltransferase